MSNSLEKELEELESELSEARQKVAAGRLVDLTAFAERLRGVCGRLEAAEAGEGRRHIDTLLGLRDELLQLAEGVQAILGELTGSLPPGAPAPPAPGP